MIIFLADGRLGNQIFQYMFLKTIQKNNEKIVVSDFEDLIHIFEIKDILNLNKKNRWIRNILCRIAKPVLNFLSNFRMISSVEIVYEEVLENYRRETNQFITKNGLFKNIKFIKMSFFQSEEMFNKVLSKDLLIKDIWLNQAKQFLKPFSQQYKVFIHIRRGDYKNFKVYGKNTLLPMGYFHNQIEWFIKNKDKLIFIFLSDEPDFIETEFDYLKNKIISKNSYEVDFAIMTLCNGAALSPSSFSWWGSYLMQDRDIVFAPKYWLGFESKVEYHKMPLANYMKE